MSNQVAQTILEQLGGNRFIAMTGAKNLLSLDAEGGLQFRIGRGATDGINCVRIELTSADLYTVKFYRVRGVSCVLVSEFFDVYADMLRTMITAHTGFRVTL
jgi:hypothetical protein